MNIALTLSEYLSAEKREAIEELVGHLEFLPISCLLNRGDEFRVISRNRVIPDDFIYVLTKGELSCTVGDEQRVITPGDFMMVPAGQPHSANMAEGINNYEVYALHMHLYDETRHRFLQKMDSSFGTLREIESWKLQLAACTCLMGLNPEAGSAYMKQLVTFLLSEQFLLGHNLRSLPAKMDERIGRLLGAIRSEPSRDWTVTKMAETCYLSVSRFRHLFVATTGVSPKKYVQTVRLSLARSLLITRPELTVEQVADQVGIADAHYFHAIYKKHFGDTPKRRSPY